MSKELWICPKSLACSRLNPEVERRCIHTKPHEKDEDYCSTTDCNKLSELRHYKCKCVPISKLREGNQIKLQIIDL